MPEQDYTPSDIEWAWAAGLFEGEGYIGNREYKRKTKGGGAWTRCLVLSMTDEDVVLRFQKIVGAGNIGTQQPKYEGSKLLYRWQTARWTEVERILHKLLPYLGERRAAAAHESLAKPPPEKVPRTHCRRGHELTPENTYVYKNARACRTCIRNRRKKK